MESKEKNTKEKILEEALKLFAQSGYMGTSMNDIASKLGVTKAALYKHYKSKQEILDSIIEKMNELDIARVKLYEMPEGDLEKVTAEYKETAFDKIKQYLASGPLTYYGSFVFRNAGRCRKSQTALDFYGPIFLLYSIYDGTENKSHVIKLLEEHMDHFLQEMQIR